MPRSDASEHAARSKTRRLLFGLALVGVVAVAVESVCFVGFLFVGNESFGYEKLGTERDRVRGLSPEIARSRQLRAPFLTLHPFFGYAANPDRSAPTAVDWGLKVNEFGFLDRNAAIHKRSDDKFIVGVLGASVAVLLCELSADVLRTQLSKVPGIEGREIVVVCLAVGGFKQPQQLMALNYVLARGGEFDVVVNLDGFNEVAISEGRRRRGVDPMLPWKWDILTNAAPTQEFLRRAGELTFLQQQRRELAESFSGTLASHSVTMQLLWKIRDRSAERSIAESSSALAQYTPPQQPRTNLNADDMFDTVAKVWAQSSVQIDRVCKGLDTRYLHFLQPSQYVPGSKPMGDAEKRIAVHPDPNHLNRAAVAQGYPRLLARAERLQSRGVRFIDLRSVFRGVEQALYIDSMCHFSAAGTAIVARRIAAAIADDRLPAKGAAIRLEAEAIALPSPIDPVVIEVVGVLEDGQRRSFRWAHSGTTYACSNREAFSISNDGEVIAKQEGTAVVTIRNGRLETRVEITSRWGASVPFGIGIPGAGGLVPRLRSRGVVPSLGNAKFELIATQVAPGAKGYLIFSPRLESRLLGGREIYVDPSHPRIPIVADGRGRVTFSCPVPDDTSLRGKRGYWQAFFEDPDAAIGKSASNGLMITAR